MLSRTITNRKSRWSPRDSGSTAAPPRDSGSATDPPRDTGQRWTLHATVGQRRTPQRERELATDPTHDIERRTRPRMRQWLSRRFAPTKKAKAQGIKPVCRMPFGAVINSGETKKKCVASNHATLFEKWGEWKIFRGGRRDI